MIRAMMVVLALVATFAAATPPVAAAGADKCSGRDCSVVSLRSTVGALTKSTASLCLVNRDQPGYSWGAVLSTSNFTLGPMSNNTCVLPISGSSSRLNMTLNDDAVRLMNRAYTGAGTSALPSFAFDGDNNTGFYSPAADNIGVALGGAEAFRFRSGGYLSDTTLNATLTLNNGIGSRLQYGTSMLTIDGQTIALSAGAYGVTVAGQDPTSFYTAGARRLHVETNTGFPYWQATANPAQTTAYDLGGAPHPTLQRRLYLIDVGTESAAAPTWQDAPRSGATTATITVTETSNGAVTTGTSPYVRDLRQTTTSTVAANIASLATTAVGAKMNRGPRLSGLVMPGGVITATRIWCGLGSVAPTAADTLAGEYAMLRYSTVAVDAKWQFCTRDGATQSCSDTGVTVAASTAAQFSIDCREGTACTVWVDGVARARKTTNLPAAGTNMNVYCSVETTAGGTARSLAYSSLAIEYN